MRYKKTSFRLAEEILSHREEWTEFQRVVATLAARHVEAIQDRIAATRPKAPAGAQSAVNQYFREHLTNWVGEPRLFGTPTVELRGWKMDFIKNKVGVEISFNHAEAIPWTFSRLNIAGESERVVDQAKIEVGIAVFATESLKLWGKMDNAVGTYETAIAWLREMKPILPIPILILGLDATDWAPSTKFRGTRGRVGPIQVDPE
jgi:hypothetical protein